MEDGGLMDLYCAKEVKIFEVVDRSHVGLGKVKLSLHQLLVCMHKSNCDRYCDFFREKFCY